MPPKKDTNSIIRKYKLDKQFKPSLIKRTIVKSEDRHDEVKVNYDNVQQKLVEKQNNCLQETVDKEKQYQEEEETINQLKSDLAKQRINYTEQIQKFDHSRELELKQLATEHIKEISEIKKTIDDMTDQLNYMNKYQERKLEYVQEIQVLNKELEKENKDFELDQERQHNAFQNKRKDKEAETAEKIEFRKKKAKQDAQSKIKHSEQTINENYKLQEDLTLHDTEIQQLRKEREEIIKENESLKIELNQNSIGIQEYQSINHKQSVKIKKLKEKTEYLNNFISNEVKQYPQKLEDIKLKQIQKIEQEDYDFKCLTDQLRKKVKEIKHMKGLTQMILDQRSDIEIFFLDALQQVRQDYALNIKTNPKDMQQNINNSGSIKLPDINSGINRSSDYRNQASIATRNQTKQKIEIQDLDIEDREQILRIVFQKMNSGQPAKNWRSYSQPNFNNNSQISQENDNYNNNNTNSYTNIPAPSYHQQQQQQLQEQNGYSSQVYQQEINQ